MAVNPSDTRYAISKETVAGTTNATPAFLVLDYMDGTEVVYESDWLESPTRRANRACLRRWSRGAVSRPNAALS